MEIGQLKIKGPLGQINSKCLFVVFNVFQKKPKTRCIVVKTNSFLRLLEEFMAWHFAFKINWHLATSTLFLKNFIVYLFVKAIRVDIHMKCPISPHSIQFKYSNHFDQQGFGTKSHNCYNYQLKLRNDYSFKDCCTLYNFNNAQCVVISALESGCIAWIM